MPPARSMAMPRNKRANAPKTQQKEQSVSQSQSVQSAYQGPKPSADQLLKYNQITPGLADRIVAMAEKESSHRHAQEKVILDTDSKLAISASREVLIGQVFGLIIGLATISAGTFLAYSGNNFAGGAIGSAGVIGLVSVFVLGRSKS